MGRSSSTCHSWLKRDQRDDDQQDLDGDEDDHEEAEQVLGKDRRVEAVLRAGEPAGRRDGGEDGHDHREDAETGRRPRFQLQIRIAKKT